MLEPAMDRRATPARLLPASQLLGRRSRRRFSPEYKLRILREADACTRPGEVTALLRREGLYTSHLSYWRKQRDAGALKELAQRRGRKPADPRDAEIAALRRRAEHAEAKLEQARKVIEIQENRLWAGGSHAWPRAEQARGPSSGRAGAESATKRAAH